MCSTGWSSAKFEFHYCRHERQHDCHRQQECTNARRFHRTWSSGRCRRSDAWYGDRWVVCCVCSSQKLAKHACSVGRGQLGSACTLPGWMQSLGFIRDFRIMKEHAMKGVIWTGSIEVATYVMKISKEHAVESLKFESTLMAIYIKFGERASTYLRETAPSESAC